MQFPVAEAQIVALFVEAVAYGLYLVTLGLAVGTLVGRVHARRGCSWPLAVVVAAMAVFATLDVAFGLKHNLDAFVFYRGAGGPDAEFEDISYWVNVMKTIDTQVMTLIGDGMLIYRCLVIFSYQWSIIALPALLWLAQLTCSIIIIYITSTLRTHTLLSKSRLTPLLTAFLALTLATNVLTTGLIVWRIACIDRATAPFKVARRGRSRLTALARIIVESGLLYTAFVLATFGAAVAGSNAIYAVSDVMVIVVGISFNLIIIRVDRGVAAGTACAPSIPLQFRELQGEHPALEISLATVVESDEDAEGSETVKDGASVADEMPKDHWDV